MKRNVYAKAMKRVLTWGLCMAAGIIFCQDLPAETRNDTLRLWIRQTPNVLTPHLGKSFKDVTACRIVFEPLASFDSQGNLVPFLAAEIPSIENKGVAADGLSVTWKLKPHIRWADGKPFTAHDVRFTYDFIMNPQTQTVTPSNYQMIKHIVIIDDLTLKIEFKKPNPLWFTPFVGHYGLILPRHIYEPHNNASIRKMPPEFNAIGTGPYRMETFNVEDMILIGDDLVNTVKIIYTPNDYFREPGKPGFKRLELRAGGDHDLSVKQLIEGELDYIWGFQTSPSVIGRIESSGKANVLPWSKSLVELLLLNRSDPIRETDTGERSSLKFSHPFFRDKKVRQAFAHAIDRKKIREIFGKAAYKTSNILTSPEMYNSSHTEDMYPFDLKKAAALLNDAGWRDSDGDGIRDKDGIVMRVKYQTSIHPARRQTQYLIKENLESIGVEVKLSFIDAGSFFNHDPNNINNMGHFYSDLQQFATGPPLPEPSSFLIEWWTCDQIPQQHNQWTGLNLTRWCHPEYERLAEKLRLELDHAERRKLIIRMNDMLIEDVVAIPLTGRQVFAAVHHSIEGAVLSNWEMHTWKIKDWRRKKEK